MILIAHAGHMAIDLAIYLGPVLLIALLFKRAERRAPPQGDHDHEPS